MTYDPYFHNAPTTTKETVVTGAANTITSMTTETKHKGRWHNLKKDPNDLPNDGDRVLIHYDRWKRPEWDVCTYVAETQQWNVPLYGSVDRPDHWRHLDTPEEAQ